MRSKTSYFNPTLFKKNLARFWPLWGGASALGALVPLALLMELIEHGFRSLVGKGLEVTLSYYMTLAYFVPVISLFYAALCALAVWHYLYNARSVGLLHSLPITRRGLFVTNFLSGLGMMLIPYAVTGALTILVTLAAGLFEPVGVLVTILGVIGESFFYFAFATLVVFFTGNPFAFAAFYFIFQFLAAGAEQLVGLLAEEFYLGVSQGYQGVAEFLSPTIFLTRHLDTNVVYEEIETAGGWIDRGVIQSVSLENGWLIAVYALAGVVLVGCAWALYQRRRSESAGDVVAVGWMKPIFRYGVALCAALAGGVLLYELLCATFIHTATAQTVPMAVCMAVTGLVGYYIASMLLAKSLAVFRRSGKGALATAIAAVVLCGFISADPFGVERWVPEAGAVANAGIHVYGQYGYLDVNLTDPSAIQKVLDLHRTILTEKDALDDQSTDFWEYGSGGQISLSYYDADGKGVHRDYVLPGSEAGQALESLQKAAVLVTDPVLQDANIFESIRRGDIAEARLVSGYVGDVYNTETREINGVDLTTEQAKALEAAVRRDIQAGHFGKTMFLTDDEERDRAGYYGTIQLNYNVTWKPDSSPSDRPSRYSRTTSDSRSVTFEISTYCTETLDALKKMGVLNASCRLLTNAEFYAMDRQMDGTWDYYDPYAEDYENIVYPHPVEAAGSVGMIG